MTATVPAPPRDPHPPTDPGLVGRERDLATIEALLADARLVTVVGPGGVGKTRVATAIAARRPAGSVTICELAPVPDPGGVPCAIAESLGFPTLHAATVGLGDPDRLLVVDNAEHHLDVVASAVSELTSGCRGITVLVTSQEPLDAEGEHVVALEPLPVPPDDDVAALATSPAVQLFLARAAVRGVSFGDDAIPTVASIVRRLDGLPLAIELAAARTRGLGLQEILRHLDARFELLTRRHGRGPERHRSLEATIGWSHDRLDPAVQRFFARLGAFCGPFTAEAAHNVAASGDSVTSTLDRLDLLVSRSLIDVVDREGEVSYALPESVRLYARDRLEELAEAEVCDQRCVDHYVGLAGALIEAGSRTWSVETIRSLAAAHLNLQDAIRWCLAVDDDRARASVLFVPLWGLVHNGRADAVREIGERILERWPEPRDATWAMSAAITATATLAGGDVAAGDRLADDVLAVDDGLGAAIAARARHLAAAHRHDDVSALRFLDEAARMATALDAEPFAVEAEIHRAAVLARTGQLDEARDAAARARARAAGSQGDVLPLFADLTSNAITALTHRDEGRRALQATVTAAERVGYVWATGTAHRALGAIAYADGDRTAAAAELTASLDTFLAAGQLGEVAGTLRWVAGLLVAEGRPDEAARLLLPVAPSAPLLGAVERDHLDPVLAELRPPIGLQAREAIATARAALAGIGASAVESTSGATRAHGASRASAPSDRSSPADDELAARAAPAVAGWVREGPLWALSFAGTTVRLPHAKGLADLAVLLARPGVEIAASELMGAAVDSPDLGPTIDDTARRAYERRIVELQEDLDEAETFGDLGRAEVARAELDELIDALTAATGLGGRARRTGGSDERARSAVTRRIKETQRRIEDVHPALGRHLSASVRTGRWCVYQPAEPSTWTVEDGGGPQEGATTP